MSKKEFNPDDFKGFDPSRYNGKIFTIFFKGQKLGEIKNVYVTNKAFIIPSAIILASLFLDKTKRN